jgi:hypothetical protein
MVSLAEEFGDKLAILAFPSGEFGNQVRAPVFVRAISP